MAIRTNAGVAAFQQFAPKIAQSNTTVPKYDYGIQRLQYLLNNRKTTQIDDNPPQQEQEVSMSSYDSTNPTNTFKVGAKMDNSGNLYIAKDALGYQTPMSAEEQLKLAAKYADKNMEKDAAMSGIASLSNAFGRTGGFSTVFGSYNPR